MANTGSVLCFLQKGHHSAQIQTTHTKKRRKKRTWGYKQKYSVHVNCVLFDNMYHQVLPLYPDSLSPVVTIVNVKYLSIYH